MARQRGLKLGTAIKRLKGKHRIDGEGGDHVVMGAAMGRTGTLVTLVTEVISAADTGPRRCPRSEGGSLASIQCVKPPLGASGSKTWMA